MNTNHHFAGAPNAAAPKVDPMNPLENTAMKRTLTASALLTSLLLGACATPAPTPP